MRGSHRTHARPWFALAVLVLVMTSVSCGRELTSLASSTNGTAPDATGPLATAPPAPTPAPPPPPPAVQVALTWDGVAVWDAETGTPVTQLRDAIPSPDWSTLISFPPSPELSMSAVDTTTGAVRWTTSRAAPFVPRLTSRDGNTVVLTKDSGTPVIDTGPGGQPIGSAQPFLYWGRDATELQVVTNGGPPRTYNVDANVEPEAVSLDAQTIFVIQYTPAEAPTSYRVRQLDLASGVLSDVYTDDRQLLDDMPGAARKQVRSPDGKRLYTLYNEAPSSGPRRQEDGPNTGRAFVHVLDLENKWARCVDLPLAFAGGSQANGGLAVSPDSGRVLVADAENAIVATLDTDTLQITREGELMLPFAPDGYGSTVASIARDGSVFAGVGQTIMQLDPETLEPSARWSLDLGPGSNLTSIDAATRDGDLAVASSNQVVVYNTKTRRQRRALEGSPMASQPTHLGMTESRLWRVPRTDKCSC